MLEIYNLTFKTSFEFYYFQNRNRAHARHRAFAALQIELNRVVDYDSKCSTKFHRDCMWGKYFTFKTSFDINNKLSKCLAHSVCNSPK